MSPDMVIKVIKHVLIHQRSKALILFSQFTVINPYQLKIEKSASKITNNTRVSLQILIKKKKLKLCQNQVFI